MMMLLGLIVIVGCLLFLQEAMRRPPAPATAPATATASLEPEAPAAVAKTPSSPNAPIQSRFNPSSEALLTNKDAPTAPGETPSIDGVGAARDVGDIFAGRAVASSPEERVVSPEYVEESLELGVPHSRIGTKKRLPERFGMSAEERALVVAMKQGAGTGKNGAADNARPTSSRAASRGPTVVQEKELNGEELLLVKRAEKRKQLSKEFAPFGRLLVCTTVNTVDSLAQDTVPIIGLVTKESNWNENTIIPVNTEIHGYINAGSGLLDAAGVGRLFDTGQFTLVLPEDSLGRQNGREWKIKGRIMDRREILMDNKGRPFSWGLDDLAPGLIGYTINTLDNEEIKLFVSSFLSAAVPAFAEVLTTKQPAPGIAGINGELIPEATPKNAMYEALGQGTSATMNRWSDRIAESISKRGYYIRVPASKTFYIYVEQTLDPTAADIGLHLVKE